MGGGRALPPRAPGARGAGGGVPAPHRRAEHWGRFDGLDEWIDVFGFSGDKPPLLQGEERSGNSENANRGHGGEVHLVLVNGGRQRLEGGALGGVVVRDVVLGGVIVRDVVDDGLCGFAALGISHLGFGFSGFLHLGIGALGVFEFLGFGALGFLGFLGFGNLGVLGFGNLGVLGFLGFRSLGSLRNRKWGTRVAMSGRAKWSASAQWRRASEWGLTAQIRTVNHGHEQSTKTKT